MANADLEDIFGLAGPLSSVAVPLEGAASLELEHRFGLDGPIAEAQPQLAAAELEDRFGFAADELPEAAAELPLRRNKKKVVLEGVRKFSPAWQSVVARHRWERTKTKSQFGELADGWDVLPQRYGDLADRGKAANRTLAPGERKWTHSNTYRMSSCIKGAFKEVGKGPSAAQGKVSFDACRRALEGLVTIAALACHLFWKARLVRQRGCVRQDVQGCAR